MNIKKTIDKLLQDTPDVYQAEKYLVYSFLKQYPHLHIKSDLIWQLWKDCPSSSEQAGFDSLSLFTDSKGLSMSDMVELFECLSPESEKKKKGIVYTPLEIKEYIVNNTLSFDKIPYVIDPSCGCGAFLITAAEVMIAKYHLTPAQIINQYLYGIDIDFDAVRRTKILLTLFAYMNGEFGKLEFHLYVGNALDKSLLKRIVGVSHGFDCVIGNPPYVRFRNLDDGDKVFFKDWNSSSGGNVDLYMPFFEIGITLLRKGGTLGYITSNGYLQGLNGRNLRNYLLGLSCSIEITDFRDAQMFKNVTSYTCITIIKTSDLNPVIKYVRITEKQTLYKHNYTNYAMERFNVNAPWRMRKEDVDLTVSKLETSGIPLSNWKIRNGLATLKNDLFFFRPQWEDEEFYYRQYEGALYKIEKGICINVVKPNVIKNEEELVEKGEFAIFPYKKTTVGFEILPEDYLAGVYPNAYSFLCEYRDELNRRDKGHGKYPAWYAYGRTQGMNNFGFKLLLPYVASKATAVLSLDPDLLFYCGYALISNSVEELKVLKCFLESDAFWYYIYHTSKPYSKGYMAFAKNYLVKFTIPLLSQEEIDELLSFTDPKIKNEWIWGKYKIDNKEIRTFTTES